MDSATEIVAFIRDLIIIIFSLIGIFASLFLIFTLAKAKQQISEVLERSQKIMDRIDGWMDNISSTFGTLSALRKRSKDEQGSSGSSSLAARIAMAPISVIINSIFRSRDSKKDSK